ncbi:MAG: hypothetical protein ACXU82_03750 [Caulobacteraceae bacterium]
MDHDKIRLEDLAHLGLDALAACPDCPEPRLIAYRESMPGFSGLGPLKAMLEAGKLSCSTHDRPATRLVLRKASFREEKRELVATWCTGDDSQNSGLPE